MMRAIYLEKNIFSVVTVNNWFQRSKKVSIPVLNWEIFSNFAFHAFFHSLAPKNIKKWFKNHFYILYIQTLGVSKKKPEVQTII